MDDYEFQQELEALAGNAYITADTTPEPMKDTISRWRELFNLSDDAAVDRIQEHRNNLTRTRVSTDHWETVRSEKEPRGYDREAYEYELELEKKKAALPDLLPAAEDRSVTYLVELKGALDDPTKVQHAAQMEDAPSVVSGRSVEHGRPVWLCCIDGVAKNVLLRWAAHEGGGFEPTILVNPKSLQ